MSFGFMKMMNSKANFSVKKSFEVEFYFSIKEFYFSIKEDL